MSESVSRPTVSVPGDLSFPADDLLSENRFSAVTAVVGGTWGAMEITLGGFLHALRLPFVGLVMALLQAVFFIALRRVHPMRGLMLVSGLLAAGVKLMVPSGALLAPSLGIAGEGLLLEVAFLLVPGSWAAPLGATLALLWSIGQMILSQVVLFGSDVLTLYQALLGSLSMSLGWTVTRMSGAALLLGVVGLGGAVGFWANRVGARLAREAGALASGRVSRLAVLLGHRTPSGNELEDGRIVGLPGKRDPGILDDPGPRDHSVSVRQGDFGRMGGVDGLSRWQRSVAAPACLLALVSLARPGVWSLLGLALLTGVLAVMRPSALGRLLRWRFWLLASILAFATGLVLTASRSSDTWTIWVPGAVSAAALLLLRVAILSETAILAVAWLRGGFPTRRWLRLGILGRAMAASWSIVPTALTLLETELASVQGRTTRWERLRSLPGILESLMLLGLLAAEGNNRLVPVDVSRMENE